MLTLLFSKYKWYRQYKGGLWWRILNYEGDSYWTNVFPEWVTKNRIVELDNYTGLVLNKKEVVLKLDDYLEISNLLKDKGISEEKIVEILRLLYN